MLSPAQAAATAAAIAAVQRPDGLVPWFPAGPADPWNHVEAAMALTLGGRRAEAERAYEWLAGAQHPGGTWFASYQDGAPRDRRLDTNLCAYVAVGTWQHFLATADRGFLETMFPVVEAAIGFALHHQRPGGEVAWSVQADGRPGGFALLTGSSSVCFSLRCALAAAAALAHERPHWEAAVERLAAVVASPRPGSFAPKDRYAMDWYYPVLCGAVTGPAARSRLRRRWELFVMDGLGVRCVADQPWVTAAETAECALALDACGMVGEAALLLEWAQLLRHHDGSYWTGCVHPQRVQFPGGERSTYSAAAMVLASAAVAGQGPAAGLFRGWSLPAVGHPEPARRSDRGAGAKAGVVPVALSSVDGAHAGPTTLALSRVESGEVGAAPVALSWPEGSGGPPAAGVRQLGPAGELDGDRVA